MRQWWFENLCGGLNKSNLKRQGKTGDIHLCCDNIQQWLPYLVKYQFLHGERIFLADAYFMSTVFFLNIGRPVTVSRTSRSWVSLHQFLKQYFTEPAWKHFRTLSWSSIISWDPMRWGNLILKSSNQWGREIFIHNMGKVHIHMGATMTVTKGGIRSKRMLH